MSDNLLFSWDACELIDDEVCRRREYDDEDLRSDEELREDIESDYDFWQWSWRDLYEAVTNWLEENNIHHFYVEGQRMGWRNRSGHRLLSVDTGEQFIRGVLNLDCDVTFRFYGEEKIRGLNKIVLYGTVWHHDSPTGESRQVYALRACPLCGEPIPLDQKDLVYDGDYICEDCMDYRGLEDQVNVV